MRRLPLVKTSPADEPAAPVPARARAPLASGPVIVLGSLVILAGWGLVGPWALRFGQWAAILLFGLWAVAGGALVGRLSAARPVASAALAGCCTALSTVVIGVARGALPGVIAIAVAALMLGSVGTAASALGGKLAARRRSLPAD